MTQREQLILETAASLILLTALRSTARKTSSSPNKATAPSTPTRGPSPSNDAPTSTSRKG